MKTTLIALVAVFGISAPAFAMDVPVETVSTQGATPSDIHSPAALAIFERLKAESAEGE